LVKNVSGQCRCMRMTRRRGEVASWNHRLEWFWISKLPNEKWSTEECLKHLRIRPSSPISIGKVFGTVEVDGKDSHGGMINLCVVMFECLWSYLKTIIIVWGMSNARFKDPRFTVYSVLRERAWKSNAWWEGEAKSNPFLSHGQGRTHSISTRFRISLYLVYYHQKVNGSRNWRLVLSLPVPFSFGPGVFD